MALTEPFIADCVETDALTWPTILNRQAMLSRDLKHALHKFISVIALSLSTPCRT